MQRLCVLCYNGSIHRRDVAMQRLYGEKLIRNNYSIQNIRILNKEKIYGSLYYAFRTFHRTELPGHAVRKRDLLYVPDQDDHRGYFPVLLPETIPRALSQNKF